MGRASNRPDPGRLQVAPDAFALSRVKREIELMGFRRRSHVSACQARKLDHHRWSRVGARTVTLPARESEDGDHSLP